MKSSASLPAIVARQPSDHSSRLDDDADDRKEFGSWTASFPCQAVECHPEELPEHNDDDDATHIASCCFQPKGLQLLPATYISLTGGSGGG